MMFLNFISYLTVAIWVFFTIISGLISFCLLDTVAKLQNKIKSLEKEIEEYEGKNHFDSRC